MTRGGFLTLLLSHIIVFFGVFPQSIPTEARVSRVSPPHRIVSSKVSEPTIFVGQTIRKHLRAVLKTYIASMQKRDMSQDSM